MARIVKTAANTIERLGLGCQADLIEIFEPKDLTLEGLNLLTLFINHGFAASLGSSSFLAVCRPDALLALTDALKSTLSEFLPKGYLLQLDKISPLLADFVVEAYLSMHPASELGKFCSPQKKDPKPKASARSRSSTNNVLAENAPFSAASNNFGLALLLPACDWRSRLAISVLPGSALPSDVVRRLFLFDPSGDLLGEPRDYSLTGRASFLARYLTQADQLLEAVASHPQLDPNELAWLHTAEAAEFFQDSVFAPLWRSDPQGENVCQHPILAPFRASLGFPGGPDSHYGKRYCQAQFAKAEASLIKGQASEDASRSRAVRL